MHKDLFVDDGSPLSRATLLSDEPLVSIPTRALFGPRQQPVALNWVVTHASVSCGLLHGIINLG